MLIVKNEFFFIKPTIATVNVKHFDSLVSVEMFVNSSL